MGRCYHRGNKIWELDKGVGYNMENSFVSD